MRSGHPWRDGLLLGCVALAALLLMDWYVRDAPVPTNDELVYALMARDPFEAHTFPFAYRVAVPSVAHVLPFDHETSFSWLAWIFTAGCGTLAFVLLRRFKIGRGLSAGLALSFALCPTLFVVSLRQGMNVDPQSVFVMLAGAIAIVDRRAAALGVVVFAGVFVRESTLFLLPFAYAVWADRLWDATAARRALIACIPGIVAYAALRIAVPTVAREQVLGYSSPLGGRIDVLRAAFETPQYPLRRIALAFGPLWLVAPLAIRESRYVRRGLVLVACCLLAMTFALDWGRIILLAAPVIIVAAGLVLRDRPRLALAVVATFLAMDLGYAVYMEDFDGAQDGIIEVEPSPYEIR